MGGKNLRCRVVENYRRRQAQPGGRGQAVAQFHRGQRVEADQRVEAQVEEAPVGLDRLAVGVSENRRDVTVDQVHQGVPAGLRGESGQPPLDRFGLRPGRCGGTARDRPDQATEQVRDLTGGADRGQIEADRDHRGLRCADRRVERRQAGPGVERERAGAGHPLPGVLVQATGHAAVRPRAPGQGMRRQAQRAPVPGQFVQERVGGGIVRLARRAEGGRRRGEQDERRQVQVPGQLVQVQRTVQLGPQDAVELVRGHLLDDAVGQDARGVDDRRDRVVGKNLRQGVPVGDVDGHRGDLDAQLLGQGDSPTAAAGQEQAPDAVPGHQMAGDVAGQGAGTAGDQDRSGSERDRIAGGRPGQARGE